MSTNGVPTRNLRTCGGFSLLTLLLVLASLAFLAGIVLPTAEGRGARDRDAQRLMDVQALVTAIEAFAQDRGKLPLPAEERGHAGWDTTLDGDFLAPLIDGGYLSETLLDPLNDELHHYRYYAYPKGYDGFPAEFYVVGVRGLESEEFQLRRRSWKGNQRDWGQEFDYVVGGLLGR